MGRTVADVALLLNALAAVDASDPAGRGREGHDSADYTAFLKPDALKGKRFGVLRQAMGFHPDVDASIERRDCGHEGAGRRGGRREDRHLQRLERQPSSKCCSTSSRTVSTRILKNSGAPQPSLEALIAWNKANAETGHAVLRSGDLRAGAGEGAADRRRVSQGARRVAAARRAKTACWRRSIRNKLDAVIAPSTSPAWPTDHVLGDHFVGAGYGVAAVAGTPSLTVPIGRGAGLPLGLTFMGRAYSEGGAARLGLRVRAGHKARKPPQYKPTLAP